MKKLSLVMLALGLTASTAGAAVVTIQHNTSGDLANELTQALTDNGLTEMADITELIITGEAAMNATDFTKLRENLKKLQKLDVSNAVFADNKLPGGDQWGGSATFVNGMTELIEVKLPETIKSMGGSPFGGCSKLEKVNLNDNITVIPSKCFNNCKSINFDALPARLSTIESNAFSGCSKLTTGGPLPETLTTIRDNAFKGSSVTFNKLPDKLTRLDQNAFQGTKVTFSSIPTGITNLNKEVFQGSCVTFTELPPNITTVSSYVFQSVKTMPYFVIPDQAGLWTKIPDGFFFVAADDVVRTFICRAPAAPVATVKIGSSAWSGSFSQVDDNHNTTFKVLASAMKSFQETAPYSSMNIVALTTPVLAPVVELPEGTAAEHVKVSFMVNDTEHTDLTAEVLEGEGNFTIVFDDEAEANLYVEEVRFIAADTQADGEDTGESDPNLLYAVDTPANHLKETVSVPVTVVPDMAQLYVKVGKSGPISGVENVAAAETNITRRGDMVYLSAPGAQLYDVAGKLVASSSDNTVDLSALPAGVYIIRSGKTSVKILK